MGLAVGMSGFVPTSWFNADDMSQLFARKPIDDLQPIDDGHSLKRVLGAGDLVMLAIGAVIGAGHLLVDRDRSGR